MDAHLSDLFPSDSGLEPDDGPDDLPTPQTAGDPNVFGDEIAGIETSDWAVDADIIWGPDDEIPVMDEHIDPSGDELSL